MLSQYRVQILLVVSILGGTILILSPNYLRVQAAPDVNVFGRRVAKYGATRTRWAACLDLAFAVSYAMFAATFVGCGSLAIVGVAAVAFGAASDEAENILVLVGVSRRERLTSSTLNALRTFSRLKSAGLAVGVVLVVFGCLLC